MAINLLESLESLGKTRGGFSSAIFLTYTLDLNFFEVLVAPKLDAIGCTNVLILADSSGYDEALIRSARSVTGAGTRYVCAPIVTPGPGVQHAKLLLLASKTRGQMYIGSGNLTLHGYGRNLELAMPFEVDLAEDKPADWHSRYPFSAVWQLLQQLRAEGYLSSVGTERLDTIGETAPWLADVLSQPADLAIWHSLYEPIMDRLAPSGSLRELQVIAPFVDTRTVGTMLARFHPNNLIVGTDALEPNLDGQALQRISRTSGCNLRIRTLRPRTEEDGRRLLHAKAVIGFDSASAWCLAGSANCTVPALEKSCAAGGNLELVVWQRTEHVEDIESIWANDVVEVGERNPDELQQHTDRTGPDAQATPALRLTELRCDDKRVSGRFVQREAFSPLSWSLELLRSHEIVSVRPDSDCCFTLMLPSDLKGTEAGRVIVKTSDRGRLCSPYLWIDQPAELQRYGNRSLHTRMKDVIRTFDGAGKLFEELMNFLWERVDPIAIQGRGDEERKNHHRFRGRQTQDGDTPPDETIPPPESFITEEALVESIGFHIGAYLPYDRSNLNLRDLLSLALLRLTADTAPSEIVDRPFDERNEDADADKLAQRETSRREILLRLRDYLLQYCKRYALRLADPEFVKRIGADLLFENSYTLGRVLLEFRDKAGDVFSQRNLQTCVWSIFGGLFWSQHIQLAGVCAWTTLIATGEQASRLQDQWKQADLDSLVVLLLTEAWNDPPEWENAIGDEAIVLDYLAVKGLIQRVEACVGARFWDSIAPIASDMGDLWGFRTAHDFYQSSKVPFSLGPVVAHFARMAAYRTPLEEKYATLFEWWDLVRTGQEATTRARALAAHLTQSGQEREMATLRALPRTEKASGVEYAVAYCPRCCIALPRYVIQNLQDGELAACPNCRKAVLFWRPALKGR